MRGPVRAIVDTGVVSTPYTRAGAGRSVVLLATDTGAGAPRLASLLAPLATHFRVFAPELPDALSADPEALAAFSCWLRDFLDGLGVSRASLVASETLASRALRFAASHGGRVDRVVLLVRESSDPLVASPPEDDLVDSSRIPVLLRCIASVAEEDVGAVADVIAFLRDATLPPSEESA
jgi:pimeloyl-ACP methyl ester carboxylesterase